jgi:hypothetical protein
MTPEGDKGADSAGAAGQGMTGQGMTGQATEAASTSTDDRFAVAASNTGAARVNTAYAAASKRHVHTHRAVRHTHTAKARKVVVVQKKVYVRDTRYVTVDRPVYQPPQVIYVQPRRTEVYVDREIDRTSTAYGHQVYNRYARNPAPPVVYRGLYRQEQAVYSGARQEGYAYQQRSHGYQSGSAYHSGATYHQGGGADCNCGGAPAAGRDRDGYLTWPGKTESRQY